MFLSLLVVFVSFISLSLLFSSLHFFWSLGVSLSLLGVIFFVFLLLISAVVFFFSDLYVSDASLVSLFRFYFILFVSSMGVLLLGSGWVMLFLGWEGLGLSSFYLIFFYLTGYAKSSALKTVMVNRIGDVFFLCFIGVSFCLGNTFVCVLIIFIACFCKSAVFPFYSWLPSAMAAPTPVSALVHSSTLVMAGVWILLSLEVEVVVLFLLGSVTMIIGGCFALFESDLKKIVAFSTLSQVGLVVVSLVVNGKEFGFFHMCTHSFFKSMLFVCIGAGIMLFFHNQQSSLAGFSFNSFVRLCLFVSLVSMVGVVFFSGAFSKHFMLCSAGVSGFSALYFGMMFLGFVLTAAYSVRIIFFCLNTKAFVLNTGVSMVGLLLFFFSVVLGKWAFESVIFWENYSFLFSFLFVLGLFWFYFSVLMTFSGSSLLFSQTAMAFGWWVPGIRSSVFAGSADSFVFMFSQLGLFRFMGSLGSRGALVWALLLGALFVV